MVSKGSGSYNEETQLLASVFFTIMPTCKTLFLAKTAYCFNVFSFFSYINVLLSLKDNGKHEIIQNLMGSFSPHFKYQISLSLFLYSFDELIWVIDNCFENINIMYKKKNEPRNSPHHFDYQKHRTEQKAYIYFVFSFWHLMPTFYYFDEMRRIFQHS